MFKKRTTQATIKCGKLLSFLKKGHINCLEHMDCMRLTSSVAWGKNKREGMHATTSESFHNF